MLIGAVNKDGDFKMPSSEERKESFMFNKRKAKEAEEEDEDDNLSAEDLDSDDLEDEIQDNVGDLLIQH